MRFDSASPRTWLLAAIAAWAVASLLLALFGMGARIAKLPEDPALVRALPSLPKASPERLAPLCSTAKSSIGPLFADDRRPHAFSLQPQGEDQAKAFDYVLTSVMITPTFKMAIIQPPDGRSAPLRIKLGEAHESLPNWRPAISWTPAAPCSWVPRASDGLSCASSMASAAKRPRR
jgi:general secretion pathway protein N